MNIIETLVNYDGKLSSRKIMSFIAFNLAIILIALAFLFPNYFKYPPAEILIMLFAIAGFQSTLSVISNIKHNNIEETK